MKPTILLLSIFLAACGMKGSLDLPPGPPPEPLLGQGKATTNTPLKFAPADGSTAKETAR